MGYDVEELLLRFALEHPLPTPENVEAFCALHPHLSDEIKVHAEMLRRLALDPFLGEGEIDPVAEAVLRREAEDAARKIVADLRRDLGATSARRRGSTLDR